MSRELLGRRDFRRRVTNQVMVVLLALLTVLAVIPLGSLFLYVLQQGLPALNWEFFTAMPKPVGEVGGGFANALVGTAMLIGIAAAIGIPWGIATGIFLSEYGQGKLAAALRFATDLLGSIPSIIIGLFAYSILVVPMKRFSALAGGAALAIIMVPTIARTTEELLKLVPVHIREAGLALGLPRWKVTLRIVVRGSMDGLVTGIMLAIARASGETAPLLFTAFGNRFWSTSIDQPIASLPVQIYTYAISPYDDWHRQAWAGAFMLVVLVFAMNLLTRAIFQRRASGPR